MIDLFAAGLIVSYFVVQFIRAWRKRPRAGKIDKLDTNPPTEGQS